MFGHWKWCKKWVGIRFSASGSSCKRSWTDCHRLSLIKKDMICHFVLPRFWRQEDACEVCSTPIHRWAKRCTQSQFVKSPSRPVRHVHTFSFTLLLEMSAGYFIMIMKHNIRAWNREQDSYWSRERFACREMANSEFFVLMLEGLLKSGFEVPFLSVERPLASFAW